MGKQVNITDHNLLMWVSGHPKHGQTHLGFPDALNIVKQVSIIDHGLLMWVSGPLEHDQIHLEFLDILSTNKYIKGVRGGNA